MLLDLQKLIQKYDMNITGVIHIGAHFGQELDEYAKIPSIKNVICFEPHPETFKKLQEKESQYQGRFDNLFLVNGGLGPFKCQVDLYEETANQGQSNSVLRPKIHAEQYPNIVFSNKIPIKLRPLDDYETSSTFNFINIDVQGFELEVFRGAKKTLDNIDYIMAEVNRAELYENCARVEELDSFLNKWHFDRIETSWAGQTWGDALYKKIK